MDRLYIFDTTLRDGEQVSGCQLNTLEEIEVHKAMESLGVDEIEAGATLVNSPDTAGYGLPSEYGAKVKYLMENVSNVHKAITTHCHNNLGMATANSMAGIINGARQVEVTINGLGEQAGNTALEEVVMIVKSHKESKVETHIYPKKIWETSWLVSSLINMPLQANKAIEGRNAFAHSSGIHQDGVLKNRSSYEIVDPQEVSIDDSSIVLTARSGCAGLKHRISVLGQEEPTQEHLHEIHACFMVVADRNKCVSDSNMLALQGESGRDSQQPTESGYAGCTNNRKNCKKRVGAQGNSLAQHAH